MDELLLGFQLRIVPEKLERWDAERRKTYLLREEIEIPLSVDKAVWPLINARPSLAELFIDYSTQPQAAPNGLGVYAVTASAIPRLVSYYDDGFLIGITATDEAAYSLQSRHHIQNVQPITLLSEQGWRCSGYDVADSWLCSGLLNCGYSESDKFKLSNHFGSDLNKSGLFQSIEMAASFCTESNKRVPEHAPFFVYGIWTKTQP